MPCSVKRKLSTHFKSLHHDLMIMTRLGGEQKPFNQNIYFLWRSMPNMLPQVLRHESLPMLMRHHHDSLPRKVKINGPHSISISNAQWCAMSHAREKRKDVPNWLYFRFFGL